jgi:hypothetical protein
VCTYKLEAAVLEAGRIALDHLHRQVVSLKGLDSLHRQVSHSLLVFEPRSPPGFEPRHPAPPSVKPGRTQCSKARNAVRKSSRRTHPERFETWRYRADRRGPRSWHIQDSQGQIMALISRSKSLNPFRVFPPRSEADNGSNALCKRRHILGTLS